MSIELLWRFMKTVLDFIQMKKEKQKISMVTAYDHWTAKIVNKTKVDCVLVGDSLAMVMHGFPSTLQATTEMMALHTAAVVRGAPDKFIISDMPFLSYRKDLKTAMDCVEKLMQTGAQGVKLEGVQGHSEIVKNIVQSGVPVMGHLGLTPQSVHQFGGFRVQARESEAAKLLVEQALELESLGCFSLVLECVPAHLAEDVTKKLHIPTIGIGAGVHTDGQVLVLQDLLGGQNDFRPKFLRTYLESSSLIEGALNTYNEEVKKGSFPGEKESYS
jgi:3-methyl-2-oxobutanoate hydroxymethyltransferase